MFDVAQLAGDWQFIPHVFTAGGAIVEQQLVGPNPRRYSIIFTVANAADIRIRPDPQTVLAGGIIAVQGTVYQFKLPDVGPLVMAAWFWNTATLFASITVWECIQLPRRS